MATIATRDVRGEIMNSDVQMRRMQAEDIPAVIAIEEVTSEEPWSQKAFESCLNPPFFSWVMEHDEKVIGFAILQVVVSDAHLLNFAFAPAWQHQGWGYNTLSTLLNYIIDKGVRSVSLEVRVSNEAAQALYKKCGFVPMGRRVNYYISKSAPSGHEDGLIWQLVVNEVND